MIRRSQSETVVQSSLGLDALCKRLEGVVDWDILELGPARGGNIDFWSRFSDSIYVADLYSSMPPPQTAEDSEFREPEWNRLLGLPAGRRFDVILAWDILNYFELPIVASLIRYLSGYCRPGTVLFSLIFDLQQMPEEFTVYRIMDEAFLGYEYSGSKTRACPRHHARALAAIMSQFQIAHSFRLRNGVIEYLFVYEGDKAATGPE